MNSVHFLFVITDWKINSITINNNLITDMVNY